MLDLDFREVTLLNQPKKGSGSSSIGIRVKVVTFFLVGYLP